MEDAVKKHARSGTTVDAERHETILGLIAEQAAHSPARVAVSWNGGDPWTHAELMAAADSIARNLVSRGIEPGELIGFYFPRRPEMLAGILGIMRAGAAYLPLDLAFPPERLCYMAAHAGVRRIMAWRATDVPPELAEGREIIVLDDARAGASSCIKLPVVRGDDLVHVLYTSGSTGKPKGVRILHRNLVSFMTSMRDMLKLEASDVVFAGTTLSFDPFATEIYLPLVVGARIVLATESELVDPASLSAQLRQHAVTVFQTTPSLLRFLFSSTWFDPPGDVKLLVGGEAMPRDLVEAVLPRCKELWNLYGPTEATVDATGQKLTHGSGPVPIGKPLANSAIYLLDETGAPVPDGEIGEIWIGGDGVADGYHNDPDRTARCFLPDPFASNGSRMYRTGDLGKWRDGALYFHGRADNQIKRLGYRIEPGEIEAAALAQPGILEAVTVLRDITKGDSRLILYVVAKPDARLVSRLRAALRRQLPAYMLPQLIEVLPALPRTPTGKIDRKGLPLPDTVVKNVDGPDGILDSSNPPTDRNASKQAGSPLELTPDPSVPGTHGSVDTQSVIDLIAAQAARTPDRTAIAWSGGETWTYRKLLQRADGIARTLLARNVQRGELVGVYLPRRPEMVATALGIMRAGAAYVPLDPEFPIERLRYMADHAGMRQIIVWRADDLPASLAGDRDIFVLEHFTIESAPPVALPQLSGSDPAYVLYTSGSTGKPKGVSILQRNLVNLLTSMRSEPGIAAGDVVCATTTLSFDIAALELYLPLIVGACVVVITEAERTDPATFDKLVHAHRVSMLQTTPTLLRMLLGSHRSEILHGMKLLIGGEAMPRDIAEAVLPHCRELWNMYGPTETTVWSTIHRVEHGEGAVPLGKPIANTTIYILDEALNQVAETTAGEIWIGGAGVADGYLHDPEKTAERFVPDPFAKDGSRMYRTGDLGSLRGGVLYFHGRADDQIKLRGYRIEPGDIEAAALAVPGITQAVAVAREIADGDKRLILYVVADADPDLIPRLRSALHTSLPAYMRPQHIETLDALPRTPNGKIDRKALPLPYALVDVVPAKTDENREPDQLESTIVEIWRDLLKVRKVGLHDDFFDLGGDSLLAVRVFERMLEVTGVNLPLATLLGAPTVAEQAQAFRAAGAREQAASPASAVTATPAPQPSAPAVTAYVPLDGWSPLVAVRSEGSQPPLFCIHGILGNVLNYVPLAKALGEDQPFYGLQAVGLDGTTLPLQSIPEMAARYLAEVRKLQPHGPYFLGGYSMGGMIAYEMTRQLRAQGERTGLLALFDTYGPGFRRFDMPGWERITRYREQWEERLQRARRLNFAAQLAWLGRALAWRIGAVLDRVRILFSRALRRPLPHVLLEREIKRAHARAHTRYVPQPSDVPAALFRAAKQPPETADSSTLGWEEIIAGDIEVVATPGDHYTILKQPELAVLLRAELARARADWMKK